MNVNHCYPNLKERSLLNYCVLKKSLEVVELLVDRGADLQTQDSRGFTPIIRAAYYHQWDVVDFLLERSEISRIDKIEALELVGAVILSDTRHTALFARGLEYWHRSLLLRMMDTDGCGPIVKNLPKNLKKPGRIVEWTTSEELDHIAQHRSEQEIQAFLVQSRILSAKSWAAVAYIYSNYLQWHDGDICRLVEQRRFVQVLNILWSMLETIHSFDAREDFLWLTALQAVERLIETLYRKIERDNPVLNEDTIKTSLKLILDDRKFIEDVQPYRNASELFDLIVMLAELPHLMNEDSMESLAELIQRDQQRNPVGGFFLHKACGKYSSINIQHLIIATVSLLLRAGADPNAGDGKGNGVFHAMVIASKEYNIDASIQESVARLLLDAGAHLDRVNEEKKTAADVWMMEPLTRRNSRWGGSRHHEKALQKSDLPSWVRDNSVPKLKCECARVIRSHGVPYKRLLPPHLHPFVSWH